MRNPSREPLRDALSQWQLSLQRLLRTEIARLPGVQRIVTTVCVNTIKNRTKLIECMR